MFFLMGEVQPSSNLNGSYREFVISGYLTYKTELSVVKDLNLQNFKSKLQDYLDTYKIDPTLNPTPDKSINRDQRYN